jgi:predicted nucleic acid-binding protein
MSLIDSSAWIEFLRATGSETHRSLRALLSGGGEMSTTEPVAMELLAGARSARERRRIERTLAACRLVPVDNAADWEDAAAIYQRCRRAGETPRQLFDCLIAAVAIRANLPILARDRDFELITRHTTLELAA